MTAAPRVEPAIAFVRARGSASDLAALKLFLGEPLSDGELAAITDAQNPDGGFRVPQLATELSVVGRTAEMLIYLTALGGADFGSAQAAADFLVERQRADGTWDEPEALRAASPPPHFRPGSKDVVGWETAACVVALTGIGLPLDFRAPLEWIRSNRIGNAGARLFRLEALLAYAAFCRHEGRDAEAAQRLRGEVEGLPESALAVFELNWALLGARAAGLGNAEALLSEFGAALASKQQPDGGFGSGTESNPYETVLALCSLEHVGLIRMQRPHAAGAEEPDPGDSDRTM